VAIRCNFCTIDGDGNITDRRAGRIPTEESAPLAKSLNAVSIPGIEVFVEPVKEHRFVVVFRGEGLGGHVADTDPQKTGVPPLDPIAADEASEKTAEVAIQFFEQAKKLLAGEAKANCLTMRGFACKPDLPSYEEVYGLKAAAIAVYPMYKGLAGLVGMEVVGEAGSLSEEIDVLEKVWDDYDFFFVHFKYTDSRGEDGDFDAKVKMVEEFDSVIPRVEALNPNVLIVTGDHSTPATMASHSWHPVPTMIVGDNCRTDACEKFGETEALKGGLGHFEAIYLMPLALAHADRLGKFGA
jgi:2,3-bisphosphoglycerate-independent phosphoglycerate mutase